MNNYKKFFWFFVFISILAISFCNKQEKVDISKTPYSGPEVEVTFKDVEENILTKLYNYIYNKLIQFHLITP